MRVFNVEGGEETECSMDDATRNNSIFGTNPKLQFTGTRGVAPTYIRKCNIEIVVATGYGYLTILVAKGYGYLKDVDCTTTCKVQLTS